MTRCPGPTRGGLLRVELPCIEQGNLSGPQVQGAGHHAKSRRDRTPLPNALGRNPFHGDRRTA